MDSKVLDFKFADTDLKIHLENYQSNGSLAVTAYTLEHEPFMTLSVNLNQQLNENEFFCKNYSENQGVFEELINQGIVKYLGERLEPGIYKCKILL